MPSFLNLNGLKIYRPGVYATIDASSLGGAGVSTGNIALVGNFPQFEHNEPTAFTSARDLVDFAPNDSEIALLAKLAFSPSQDANIGGGASSLTFLNVNNNSQASVDLLDASGDAAITLKSNVWGAQGNRTRVQVTNNAADSTVDITLSRNGVSEEFKNLGGEDIANVYYSGTSLETVRLDASPSAGIQVTWDKSFTGDDWALSGADLEDMLVDNSVITFAPNTGDGEPTSIVIVGTDAAGASQTEELDAIGDGASRATSNSYSSITSITATVDGGTADAGDSLQVTSTAFNLLPADYDYLGDMLTVINNAENFEVEFLSPQLIPSNEVDLLDDNDIGGESEKATLTADNYLVRQALSASLLITPYRATGGDDRLAQHVDGELGVSFLFAGGSEQSAAALTPADYESALQEIENSDVQIVVPFSDNIDILKKVKAHLPIAARAGFERNAWMGTTAEQTLDQVRSGWTNTLNDRNIAVVAQNVKVSRPDGRTAELDPRYLALILAGMQAGSPVATPLTRKRPDVIDVVTKNWHPNRDAAKAIQYGIVNLSYDSQGWRVERSVTSYLTDNNPIYSEVSANESANTSVRTLRSVLEDKIGTRVLASSRGAIEALVKQNLEQQVRDTVIKAFKDIVVEDLGDTFRVNYTMAAIEPLNFIRVAATVVRIPG